MEVNGAFARKRIVRQLPSDDPAAARIIALTSSAFVFGAAVGPVP